MSDAELKPGDEVTTGLGGHGIVVDTYTAGGRPCAHVRIGDTVTGWYAWALRRAEEAI